MVPRKPSSRKSEVKSPPAGGGRKRSAPSKDRSSASQTGTREATVDCGLDRLATAQRDVLTLVAERRDLKVVITALDRLIRDALGAAQVTFLILDGQDRGDDPVLLTDGRKVDGLVADGPGVVEQVAKAVTSWSKPLRIEAGSNAPRHAGLKAMLERGPSTSGWALPIRGQDGEGLGLILLHFDAATAPDAAARRCLEILEPLTRVAVDSARRELAAQVADERFSSLAETIPGVVYQRIVAPDGAIRYTYISEGARDLFGVDPDKVLADPQSCSSDMRRPIASPFATACWPLQRR